MKKKSKRILAKILVFLGVVMCMVGCTKVSYRELVTTEVNITGYLEEHPETYSLFTEMLYKSKTAGYLGAYGTYTVFAPNNESVKSWMTERGKSSITDFSEAEILEVVKYHVVRDTVSTVRFTDGKIKTSTLFGEFLYTDATASGFRVNRVATVIKANVYCGNGLVHGVNKVLTPPALSLAEIIETNPKYSIFSEALKATGFYDTLYFERGYNVPTEKRFQTVIVESDSVFKTLGINNFDDLKAEYSNTGNPKNKSDSLWLFMAYHISNNGNFLEDLAGMSSIYTLAPKEIVTTKLIGTTILLNDDEFNGVVEPGTPINRSNSDVLASNGVLHEASGTFKIKVRQQVPVYFDIALSPELRAALGGAYRNTTTSLVANGQVIASSVSFNSTTASQLAANTYDFQGTALQTRRPYANGDIFNLSMCANNSARIKYIDLKTPYLVRGKYKVWICYVQNANGARMQVSFNPGKSDEQVLPNIVYTDQTITASGVTDLNNINSDNLMLVQGYKRYMATAGDYSPNGITGGIKPKSGNDGTANVGRMAGIIDIQTTDRHIIRLDALGEGRCLNANTWIDMIHFIPADDLEQIYPRFHQLPGELFFRPQ